VFGTSCIMSLSVILLSAVLIGGCGGRATVVPQRSGAVEDAKVAVVDLLAVAERTQAGARLLAGLRAEADEFNLKMAASRQQLDQQLQEGRISPEEREAGEQRLRQNAKTVQSELLQKRKRVLATLHNKVASLAKGMAEQQGFTMVLVKGRPEVMMITWHVAPELDLTDRIIEEINRLYP